MTDSVTWMALTVDTLKKTARFVSYQDSTKMFIFHYRQPDKDHLLLQGSIKNDSFNITMKRFDIKKFRLVNRGFHWVNEYPYNR